MDTNKFNVGITVTVNDGRYYFDVMADDDLDNKMIRAILAGGVALTIRAEKTPKLQAEAISEVIKHLESEFIDGDSFGDIQEYR